MDKKQKHPSSDNSTDEQLFRQAIDGVVPLRTTATTVSTAPRPVAGKLRQKSADYPVDSNSVMDAESQLLHDSEPAPSHRKNGVQLKIMQKLKRGRFPPGDQFDLHHMNTRTGKTELLKFIGMARDMHLESIRIIHGKGLRSKDGPRLKLMTRQVLRDHPHVLAYTACKPADGGDGATDVLLKS